MRNPGGYFEIINRDGSKEEADSFTCKHCNRIVKVPPKKSAAEMGGWCCQCMAPICPGCAATGQCEPFEKKLTEYERKMAFRAALTCG